MLLVDIEMPDTSSCIACRFNTGDFDEDGLGIDWCILAEREHGGDDSGYGSFRPDWCPIKGEGTLRLFP